MMRRLRVFSIFSPLDPPPTRPSKVAPPPLSFADRKNRIKDFSPAPRSLDSSALDILRHLSRPPPLSRRHHPLLSPADPLRTERQAETCDCPFPLSTRVKKSFIASDTPPSSVLRLSFYRRDSDPPFIVHLVGPQSPLMTTPPFAPEGALNQEVASAFPTNAKFHDVLPLLRGALARTPLVSQSRRNHTGAMDYRLTPLFPVALRPLD